MAKSLHLSEKSVRTRVAEQAVWIIRCVSNGASKPIYRQKILLMARFILDTEVAVQILC